MAEYVNREEAYPDAISNTLNAFLGSIQKAHHQNLLNEVEFVDTVSKLKNIETKLEAGILTIEQALTLMQSLPAIEYVDEEGFGLDTARITDEYAGVCPYGKEKHHRGGFVAVRQPEGGWDCQRVWGKWQPQDERGICRTRQNMRTHRTIRRIPNWKSR